MLTRERGQRERDVAGSESSAFLSPAHQVQCASNMHNTTSGKSSTYVDNRNRLYQHKS
jgi:hypothetical protein